MFKKKKQNKKLSRVTRYILILVWRGFKKVRVRENIAKANAWATENPKMTTGMTIGMLSFFVVFGVAGSLVDTQKDNTSFNPMSNIEDVNTRLQGFEQIQQIKSLQKERLGDFLSKGESLQREFDSLYAIKNKSHEDSVRMIVAYKQLKIVSQTFEPNIK